MLSRTLNTKHWTSEEVYDEIKEQARRRTSDDFLNQLGELLDEHLDWEGDGEEDGNNNSNISSKQPKYSKEQMREIRDEVKENMMTAAQCRRW